MDFEDYEPFIGSAEQTVDSTNRIIVPAAFRENMKESFYLCQGINEPCIWILPPNVFKSLLKKLRKEIAPTESLAQRWIGVITSTAAKKKLDKQHRMSIPPELLKLAGITGKVKIVGHDERAEIWDYDRYEAKQIDFYNQSVEINQKYDLKGYIGE